MKRKHDLRSFFWKRVSAGVLDITNVVPYKNDAAATSMMGNSFRVWSSVLSKEGWGVELPLLLYVAVSIDITVTWIIELVTADL